MDIDYSSIRSLIESTPTDQECIDLFIKTWYPNGLVCPCCSSNRKFWPIKQRKNYYECADCKKRFSITKNTLLKKSKLTPRQWVEATYMLTVLKGTTSRQLSEMLGITKKSAWYLGQRIRQGQITAPVEFKGVVQADEAYFGPKLGRRSYKYKYYLERTQGKNLQTKIPCLFISEEGSKQVQACMLRNTTGSEIVEKLVPRVAAKTRVVTDDSRSYNSIPYKRVTVNHSAHQYQVRQRRYYDTNSAESSIGWSKSIIQGMHRGVSEKHFERYLAETLFHRNNCRKTKEAKAHLMLKNLYGKTLTYEILTSNPFGLNSHKGRGPDFPESRKLIDKPRGRKLNTKSYENQKKRTKLDRHPLPNIKSGTVKPIRRKGSDS